MEHVYPAPVIMSEADDANLREMFQQCIEIHHGKAELSELAMMFCRSHFAGLSSLFVDCYDEFIEMWQMACPLVLRRYLLKHRQTFTISGVHVTSSSPDTKIPEELLRNVWYLKNFVLEKFSGTVELSSLVRALLEDPIFLNSTLGRLGGETANEVRKFATACFSVFKVDHSKDIVYVVGSRKTLVDPVAKNAVDEILRKLRVKPRKISELVNFKQQKNAMLAVTSMYTFLSSFPFVFEVKKDSDGLEAFVFALQKHEDGLYKALDEISQGKPMSCPIVKESFQFCLNLLGKNWGRMDLGCRLDSFTNLGEDFRHLRTAIGSNRRDVVNFLSIFPSFFSVEEGRLMFADENEGSIPDELLKLAKETYAEKLKEKAKVADKNRHCNATKNSTSQAAASTNRGEKLFEVAADNDERITDGVIETCVDVMRCAGGLVPSEQLSLEELTEKCANYLSEMHQRKLDRPLTSLLEKFPTKFYLTPDRLGVVLTEVIKVEESRLRSATFRGFAQFLASDIATYSGSLTIKAISDHTNNVSPCTFKNANVIKGNVASIAAFLASFPSLFCLERNLVHVNPGWWNVLWPTGNTTVNAPEACRATQVSTKSMAESVETVASGKSVATQSANATVKAEAFKVCSQSLKRFGGIMSTKWLLIRVRHAAQLNLVLKCPHLQAEKRLVDVLLGAPTVFLLTPDHAGVVLTEVLSNESVRLENIHAQDLLKTVVSKLVACGGIPLPVAAISRCICLSRELTGDTFRNTNVPREDSGCLGAFLLSFPSLFVFESNSYSGRVSLKRGWREFLNSAGVRLVPDSNVQPNRPPEPQNKPPTEEDRKAYDEKFQFCIDTLELHGGTTSLDALVTEFQYLQGRRVDTWEELQKQFSTLVLRHSFHFLLTADKRGIVLRSLISKERERLSSPVLKDFVTHAAVDLANDGGSLTIHVLSHHLLRLSDETFRKANVFKGDCGSLEAFLASFPSVFSFDKTGDVVSLTKNWRSVSNGAACMELEGSSSDPQEPVVLPDDKVADKTTQASEPAMDAQAHSAASGTPVTMAHGTEDGLVFRQNSPGQKEVEHVRRTAWLPSMPGYQGEIRNESAIPVGSQTSSDKRRLFSDVTRGLNQPEQVASPRELPTADEQTNQGKESTRFDTPGSPLRSLSGVPAPSLPGPKRLCFTKEGTAVYLDSNSQQNVDQSNECPGMFADPEHALDFLKEEEERLYLKIFPPVIQSEIEEYVVGDVIIDVVMNTGTRPQLRYMDPNDPTRTVSKQLTRGLVTHRVIKDVLKKPCLGPGSADNRCGIEGTLHRLSVTKNRKGKTVGLTARYGRAMYGCVTDMVYDLVCSGKSVLVLGEAEVGKTTVLREFARVLNDDLGRRVLIIDTSNAIAGEGNVPHIAVGGARRIMVHPRESQSLIMAEGFRNHNPEVIVVDEITSEREAEAVRVIAQRGVQFIASTHAQSCEELVANKTFWPLIGGLRRVCPFSEQKKKGVGDAGYERLGPPEFGALIEMQKRDRWVVHLDLQASIDSALLHQPIFVQTRERIHKHGRKMVHVTQHTTRTTALQVT